MFWSQLLLPHAGTLLRRAAPPPLSLSQDCWASLFPPLLATIFRRVLEHEGSVATILRAWERIALCCKSWRAALVHTPLCLELTSAAHLSPAARSWLANAQLEALLLSRTIEPPPHGADRQLLVESNFQANSSIALRSLVNASLACAPLLPRFSKLEQASADPAVALPWLLAWW